MAIAMIEMVQPAAFIVRSSVCLDLVWEPPADRS
jgi:hypothetical protein